MTNAHAHRLAQRYIDGNIGVRWCGKWLTLATEDILAEYIAVLFMIGLLNEKQLEEQGLI